MLTVHQISDLRDLDAAFTIRYNVFVGEQNVPAEAEYDAHDRAATTRHYLARLDGEPAGAARWRPTEHGVKLERFAVLPAFRNQGVGEALVQQVLADVACTSYATQHVCALNLCTTIKHILQKRLKD